MSLPPVMAAEELEERFVLDQAVVLEHIHHVVKAVLRGDGDGDGVLLLVQGQHVVGGDPAHTGQQSGYADDDHHVEHGKAGGAGGAAPAPAVLGGGRTGCAGRPPGGLSFCVPEA